MCRVDRVGGWVGGGVGIIDPEPKMKETCNFIYVVRMAHLSFMPNYS